MGWLMKILDDFSHILRQHQAEVETLLELELRAR